MTETKQFDRTTSYTVDETPDEIPEATWLVGQVDWSPDGQLIAVNMGVDVQIWDAETSMLVDVLDADFLDAVNLSWSPNSTFLGAASEIRAVIWSAAAREQIAQVDLPEVRIRSIVWSPDNASFVTLATDNYYVGRDLSTMGRLARQWDLQGNLIEELAEAPAQVLVSPDNNDGWIIATSTSEEIRVNRDEPGSTPLVINANLIIDAIFSPEFNRVATFTRPDDTEHSIIQVWDVDTEEPIFTIEGNYLQNGWFSPLGDQLLIYNRDRVLELWDIHDQQRITSLNLDDQTPPTAAWASDGACLALGIPGGEIVLIDAGNGETKLILEGHLGRINDLAWSPDNTELASTGADGLLRIWSAETS